MDEDAFEHAQSMYRMGTSMLSLVLKSTDCEPSAGYILFNRYLDVIASSLPKPTGKRTAMSLSISAPDYNHAVGVIFNNEAKTFSFLDSSFEETERNPKRVIAVLKRVYPTYTYTSGSCPRDILPQRNDPLCTMWSYFLISKSCQGIDLREYLRTNTRRTIQDEFYEFIESLYFLFKNSDLHSLYEYFRSTFVNLLLSQQYQQATILLRQFRNQQDQRAFVDSMQDLITQRSYAKYSYLGSLFISRILHALQNIPASVRQSIIWDIANAPSLIVMVHDLLLRQYGRYLLLEALHGDDTLLIDSTIARIYNEHYIPYSRSIEYELRRNNISMSSDYPIADFLTRTNQWNVPIDTVFVRSTLANSEKDILSRILADPVALRNYLSAAYAGRNMQQYLYTRFYVPASESLLTRSYPELLFLYYVYTKNKGRRILDPNVDDLVNIGADRQVIIDALTDVLEYFHIDPADKSQYPIQLRTLFDTYYPAGRRSQKERVRQFLRLVNFDTGDYDSLEESNITVLPEFTEEGRNYEYRILYGNEPIEDIAQEYEEASAKYASYYGDSYDYDPNDY